VRVRPAATELDPELQPAHGPYDDLGLVLEPDVEPGEPGEPADEAGHAEPVGPSAPDELEPGELPLDEDDASA
jgi:hypothetical protein